ncbi:MAG TPA: hypothetical protein VFR32_04025 [Gaiellaceae bacterium]|nr:hypothetical protein [Gaiellaceae bacterium]
MSRIVGIACLLFAAAVAMGLTYDRSAGTACVAAPVHWEWNARARGVPWIAAGPAKSRLEGVLFGYRYLGDGRVNGSEGAVLLAGRAVKIAWYSKKWGGSRLTVTGRRLDGKGSFRQTFRATLGEGWYPSGILVPAAGCWQLRLRTEGWTRRLVVQAVDPAPEGTCDATPVGPDGSVKVVPSRSGVSGAWSWKTPEGGALLYVGGKTPSGGNTKVLWRARPLGGTLVVSGSRLDGVGAFRQEFKGAGGPQPGYWPSIVVVPEAGCWLLTVRIVGQTGAAGIVVTRVVAP